MRYSFRASWSMPIVLFVVVAASVSACGIQRPLIKPKDIPAYEQKQRDKIEKRQRDMDEFERQQREQELLMPQV